MNKHNTLFIIEHEYNADYITSLLVGMFYVSSSIDSLLTNNIKEYGMYLQEYLNYNFIYNIRNNRSILKNIISYIRYNLFKCGWCNEDDILNYHKVNKLYDFFIEIFNGDRIEIMKEIVTSVPSSIDDISEKEYSSYITFNVDKYKDEVAIDNLLDDWMYNNKITVKKKVGNEYKTLKGNMIINILNIPKYIGFHIDRGKNNDIRIDIKSKIHLFNKSGNINKKNMKWLFHCAICFNKDNDIKYYYTLLKKDDTWVIFSDYNIPCINIIDINKHGVIDKIKRECVFLLYVM